VAEVVQTKKERAIEHFKAVGIKEEIIMARGIIGSKGQHLIEVETPIFLYYFTEDFDLLKKITK
jgi:hypothetical protein